MSSPTDVTIDTDLARIDLDTVHRWLSTDAYWALGRSRDVVERAAEASINIGAYDENGVLCGYGRLVTDRATFAWLCDVYVPRSHRGRGIGLLIARAVVDIVTPMHLKRTLLGTGDAHGLYAKVGFVTHPDPGNLMILMGDEA